MRFLIMLLAPVLLSGCASQTRLVEIQPEPFQQASLIEYECPDGSIGPTPESCRALVEQSQPPSKQKQVTRAKIASAPQPRSSPPLLQVTRQPEATSPAAPVTPAKPTPSTVTATAAELPTVPQSDVKREAKAAATTAAIVAMIINESRGQYYATGRPCACPSDRAKNGSLCGGRSANSRPGGEHPLCYPSEVTGEMIATRRQRMAQQ